MSRPLTLLGIAHPSSRQGGHHVSFANGDLKMQSKSTGRPNVRPVHWCRRWWYSRPWKKSGDDFPDIIYDGFVASKWQCRSLRTVLPAAAIEGMLTRRCLVEIDSATFDTMWKMSEPGADAEHCFLRIQETQFFYDGRNGHYEWYPEVRQTLSISYLSYIRLM